MIVHAESVPFPSAEPAARPMRWQSGAWLAATGQATISATTVNRHRQV
jgi:hypothetical protein